LVKSIMAKNSSKPSADKRMPSSKTKKMADGGIAGLGGMIANGPPTPPTSSAAPKSSFSGPGGGGGNLSAGLDAISSGAQNASAALDRVRTDLGASSPVAAKKGGHITTRRMSSVSRSKKSPSW
jgi:hypothetical protein